MGGRIDAFFIFFETNNKARTMIKTKEDLDREWEEIEATNPVYAKKVRNLIDRKLPLDDFMDEMNVILKERLQAMGLNE